MLLKINYLLSAKHYKQLNYVLFGHLKTNVLNIHYYSFRSLLSHLGHKLKDLLSIHYEQLDLNDFLVSIYLKPYLIFLKLLHLLYLNHDSQNEFFSVRHFYIIFRDDFYLFLILAFLQYYFLVFILKMRSLIWHFSIKIITRLFFLKHVSTVSNCC